MVSYKSSISKQVSASVVSTRYQALLSSRLFINEPHQDKSYHQGPVVQSIVSLTSSLRVISFIVLADSIHNILIFFAEKM